MLTKEEAESLGLQSLTSWVNPAKMVKVGNKFITQKEILEQERFHYQNFWNLTVEMVREKGLIAIFIAPI